MLRFIVSMLIFSMQIVSFKEVKFFFLSFLSLIKVFRAFVKQLFEEIKLIDLRGDLLISNREYIYKKDDYHNINCV